MKIKIMFCSILMCFQFFSCAAEWQLPAIDLSASKQSANEPQIAMDDSGNAIAVWYRYNDYGDSIIQASRYSGGSWTVPLDLSESLQNAFSPQIAMNASGNAIAVWYRSNGSNDIVQVSHYNGSSWTAPSDLSVAGQNAFGQQIAMDEAGNAIAVWQRFNGINYIVQASCYNGVSWTASSDLSIAGQNAQFPQIAIDTSGNAIAVWVRSNIVQASRYSGGSWTVPSDLSDSGGSSPQIAMDETGNAIAVWYRSSIVQASRYSGGSWTTPSNLSEGGSFDPQIAMNEVGNATVVWSGSDGSNVITQAKRYDVLTDTWSINMSLSATGQEAEYPQIAMNVTGDAIAVWDRYNDDGDAIVQAARFVVPPIPPTPTALKITGLTAKKVCHRFPTQVDLIHVLQWDAFEGAIKYRIYCDKDYTQGFILNSNDDVVYFSNPKELVAQVSAGTLCVELHGRCPGKRMTYYVVAVDTDGDSTEPVSITI